MTNEQLLEDLKQFVAATVSQATAELPTRGETDGRFKDIDNRFDSMEQSIQASEVRILKRIDQVQDAIADTLTVSQEAQDKRLQAQIDDVRERVEHLEARAA